MKRLYISGPMTGLPDLNFPALNAAAAEYRDNDYDVVNPAELNADASAWLREYVGPLLDGHRLVWSRCMRNCIAALVTCDEILMLRGWEKSEGAVLERHIAVKLGLPIKYQGAEHAGL